VYLSVPRGLTISGTLHPIVVRLLTHLSSRQMPITVAGDVEWLVNRGEGDAWYVALFNPAGQAKPQQGITPTDYRQNKSATIRARFPIHAVFDWLSPDEAFEHRTDDGRRVTVVVPAGGVRILEIR
jgi:hypothetical protein